MSKIHSTRQPSITPTAPSTQSSTQSVTTPSSTPPSRAPTEPTQCRLNPDTKRMSEINSNVTPLA